MTRIPNFFHPIFWDFSFSLLVHESHVPDALKIRVSSDRKCHLYGVKRWCFCDYILVIFILAIT
ncbi:hypothetical protein C0J52_08350 [Blattella germanica]|nr:hypothetical protein C0J52_08350 [Blattella germanica]